MDRAAIEKLKRYLKEEYGITSSQELVEKAKKAESIDIGIFTTPLHKSGMKAS